MKSMHSKALFFSAVLLQVFIINTSQNQIANFLELANAVYKNNTVDFSIFNTTFTIFEQSIGSSNLSYLYAGRIYENMQGQSVPAFENTFSVKLQYADNSSFTATCDVDGLIFIMGSTASIDTNLMNIIGNNKINNFINLSGHTGSELNSLLIGGDEANPIYYWDVVKTDNPTKSWRNISNLFKNNDYIMRYNSTTQNVEVYQLSGNYTTIGQALGIANNNILNYYSLIFNAIGVSNTQNIKPTLISSYPDSIQFNNASANSIDISSISTKLNSSLNSEGFYMIPVLTDSNGFYVSNPGITNGYLQLYFIDKETQEVYYVSNSIYNGGNLTTVYGFGLQPIPCKNATPILFTQSTSNQKTQNAKNLITTSLNSSNSSAFYLIMTDLDNNIPYVIANGATSGFVFSSNSINLYNSPNMTIVQNITQPGTLESGALDIGIVCSLVVINNVVYLYIQTIGGQYLGYAQLPNLTQIPSKVKWTGGFIFDPFTNTDNTNSAVVIMSNISNPEKSPINQITIPLFSQWGK